MKKLCYAIAILFLLLLSPGAMAQMPLRNPAWVQVNPPFEGVEAAYSSATINAYNYYGNYWFDVVGGVVPAAPHNLLDGVVHPDTVAQVPNLGSIIVADATPDWNELVIGAPGDVLTVAGGTAVWAAPAIPAGVWAQVAEVVVGVTGADYMPIRTGVAIVGTIDDVAVLVTCRTTNNSGVMWNALSTPMPVDDMVTYYWVEHADGDLEVHVVNDTSTSILATVSWAEL